jgi:hypothetical protein
VSVCVSVLPHSLCLPACAQFSQACACACACACLGSG